MRLSKCEIDKREIGDGRSDINKSSARIWPSLKNADLIRSNVLLLKWDQISGSIGI